MGLVVVLVVVVVGDLETLLADGENKPLKARALRRNVSSNNDKEATLSPKLTILNWPLSNLFNSQ